MNETIDAGSDSMACDAVKNVADYFGYIAYHNYLQFWRFVGLEVYSQHELLKNSYHDGNEMKWKLPSHLIRRLEALAGPHHKTFIKAMIKTGAIVPTKPFFK